MEQLERKTFLKVLLLEKTVFNVRQKGVSPLLLPANVQQLPRCLVRICNLFHKGNQIANWKVSKSAIAAGGTCCKIICFANVGCSPTPRQHFWKTAAPKNFQLPAACCLETMLLGKPIFHIRQKGVPPLLLPTSVQQLPRCLVRICNLFHKDNQLWIGKF